MTITLTIIFFVGLALGQRLQVFVLVPTTIVVVVAAISIAAADAQTLSAIVAWVFASIAILQIGYLAGAGLRASCAVLRRPRGRTVATSSSLRGAFH
jgi:hypothetical protein